MNKEKFMQLISESLEKEPFINIHLTQHDGSNPVSKETAESMIHAFKDALGSQEEIEHEERKYANNYRFTDGHIHVCCSYVPNPGYLYEDVNLDGGEKHAV